MVGSFCQVCSLIEEHSAMTNLASKDSIDPKAIEFAKLITDRVSEKLGEYVYSAAYMGFDLKHIKANLKQAMELSERA
jgi:hypothetical protein